MAIEKTYTFSEVCKIFRINRVTLWRYIKEKKIQCTRISKTKTGNILFLESKIKNMLKNGEIN